MTDAVDAADARALVAALAERGLTLATSESLTGGLVAAAVTSVPGASTVYLGGAVAYATAMKAVLGGVDPMTLARHGAVSSQTALALAVGIRERAGSDWAVATTGVAGPDPQEGHPPGEVWIAVAGPDGSSAVRRSFTGDRGAIRAQTVADALALVFAAVARSRPGVEEIQDGRGTVPPEPSSSRAGR